MPGGYWPFRASPILAPMLFRAAIAALGTRRVASTAASMLLQRGAQPVTASKEASCAESLSLGSPVRRYRSTTGGALHRCATSRATERANFSRTGAASYTHSVRSMIQRLRLRTGGRAPLPAHSTRLTVVEQPKSAALSGFPKAAGKRQENSQAGYTRAAYHVRPLRAELAGHRGWRDAARGGARDAT